MNGVILIVKRLHTLVRTNFGRNFRIAGRRHQEHPWPWWEIQSSTF